MTGIFEQHTKIRYRKLCICLPPSLFLFVCVCEEVCVRGCVCVLLRYVSISVPAIEGVKQKRKGDWQFLWALLVNGKPAEELQIMGNIYRERCYNIKRI